MRLIGRTLRAIGAMLLWIVIAALLLAVLVPPFLDRIYYAGPQSPHFDGARFFNPDGEPIPGLSGPRGGILTRLIPGNRSIQPNWPEHVAVRQLDPAKLPRLRRGEMRVVWVGHATMLIQTPRLNILTDPVWSDVAGPFGFGPRRVMAPGIAFDRLPHIDLVVVSHDHYDHLDLSTLKKLWDRDRPAIITSLGNDRLMSGDGMAAHGLDWGQSIRLRGVTVHVTRSHHWSSRWLIDRNRALWSAFVIETDAGRIFFPGDTGPGDLQWPVEARRWGPIRLALIPIGAFRFVPGQMVSGAHIGPRDAVRVFERLNPTMALPIHWGTFHLSAEAWGTPPAMLRLFERCANIAPNRFPIVRPGTPVMVPAIHTRQSGEGRAFGGCKTDPATVAKLP